MKEKDSGKVPDFLEKSSRENKEEFVDAFKYFENANRRNRDAFCELLDYTIESKKHRS